MLLHQSQKVIASDKHRFRVVSCGRQFGKTTLAVLEMVALAVSKDDRRIAYIAPFYNQARDIAWTTLKRVLGAIKCDINESRLEITVPTQDNGKSKIYLRGWESIESFRGQQFDFLVPDEVASMRRFWEGWEEVLLPTLAFRKGQALFISTPKGYNHFWELYNKQDTDADYKSFHFTSYDNPHLDKEFIDKNKESLPEARFAQEWLAEFRKMEGLIWPIDDTNIFKDGDAILQNAIQFPDKVIAGVDWGFDHPAAIVIVKIKDGSYYVVDTWKASKKTEKEVLDKAKELGNKHGVGVWYPDPARPEHIEQAKREGLSCAVTNKDVILGLSHVASLFKEKRLFISTKCQDLLAEIEQYAWYENPRGDTSRERPVKELDDLCDALRYVLMGYQVKQPRKIEPGKAKEAKLAQLLKLDDALVRKSFNNYT